jgi:hypothetical protein
LGRRLFDEFVVERFYHKYAQSPPATRTLPEISLSEADRSLPSTLEINTKSDRVKLWPILIYDDALWAAAALSQKPVSLCLGLADERTATEGVFENATTATTEEIHIRIRQLKGQEELTGKTGGEESQRRSAYPEILGVPSSNFDKVAKREYQYKSEHRGSSLMSYILSLFFPANAQGKSNGSTDSQEPEARAGSKDEPPPGFEYK